MPRNSEIPRGRKERLNKQPNPFKDNVERKIGEREISDAVASEIAEMGGRLRFTLTILALDTNDEEIQKKAEGMIGVLLLLGQEKIIQYAQEGIMDETKENKPRR